MSAFTKLEDSPMFRKQIFFMEQTTDEVKDRSQKLHKGCFPSGQFPQSSKVPQEEWEMANLYERRKFPYPGDEKAIEEFIVSGGTLGTTIGPKGFVDSGKDLDNFQKQLQSKKFEQEAQKLWFRMRNEVISEIQEKGYDIE